MVASLVSVFLYVVNALLNCFTCGTYLFMFPFAELLRLSINTTASCSQPISTDCVILFLTCYCHSYMQSHALTSQHGVLSTKSMSTANTNVYGKNQCLRQKPMSTAKSMSTAKQVHMQVHMLSRVIQLNNCVMHERACLVSVFASHKVFLLHITIVTKR